jgi:hypothetical protein
MDKLKTLKDEPVKDLDGKNSSPFDVYPRPQVIENPFLVEH